MFQPRHGLMNKLMRLVESWNEEPVGISVVTTGVADAATHRKCVQVLMQHTPHHKDNTFTDKLLADDDTHQSFVRVAHPRHFNAMSDIASKIRHDLKALGLQPETTLVHDELDAKLLEWSTGLTCEHYEFYSLSDLLSHLPARPSGYISIDGQQWEDDRWVLVDLSSGAADNRQLWEILRNHLFSTNQAAFIAEFDWTS